MYSILNKLLEYIYCCYISKNITSFTFLFVFKIVENLHSILNYLAIPHPCPFYIFHSFFYCNSVKTISLAFFSKPWRFSVVFLWFVVRISSSLLDTFRFFYLLFCQLLYGFLVLHYCLAFWMGYYIQIRCGAKRIKGSARTPEKKSKLCQRFKIIARFGHTTNKNRLLNKDYCIHFILFLFFVREGGCYENPIHYAVQYKAKKYSQN